jgi:hypothetical protein
VRPTRVAALVASGGLLGVPIASGAESATRVIDHTAVCQMPGVGYPDATRFMTVSALTRPPWIIVSNGPNYETRVSMRTGPGGRKPTGSLTLHRTQCAPATLRVRFSTKGLRGGGATRLGRSHQCDVPSAVLIRVRATFTRPTGFSRDPLTPSVVRARGMIATGYLAVTTVRGSRPLAFASVNNARGSAHLFVAPSRCRPER